jgi:spermidine/putrescine transport system permease protein
MANTALSSRPVASSNEEFDQGKIQRDMAIRRVGRIGLLITPLINYFFLWAPIVVLIVFSFNDSRTVASWQGFTTKWYANILGATTGEASFATGEMLEALRVSLIVAFAATITSTTIGTMVALSLVRGNFPGKRLLDGLLYLPVVIPEITQGVALLIFFNIIFDYVQSLSGQRWLPGFGTIIIGHVAFNISFVAIVVRARLADMNPRLEEAARDLGANEWKTFWRVTFPLLLPGIIAGALLAFTLSLDDYVVTFFTKGVGTTTLPIFVYGLLKLSVTPEINAISTLLLLISTILVGGSLLLQGSGAASR